MNNYWELGNILEKLDTEYPECGPGCSIAEHRHGASSDGGGAGTSTVGEIQRQVLQNAQDQEAGQPHLGKTIEWYRQVEADLDRLLEETHRDDLAAVKQVIAAQVQKLEEVAELLAQSAQATRDIEARL